MAHNVGDVVAFDFCVVFNELTQARQEQRTECEERYVIYDYADTKCRDQPDPIETRPLR